MKDYLSLIKFSHTIFALPFAMLGFVLGMESTMTEFSWQTLLFVVLCMVFARSAAMAFNRYLDRDIDAKNPRTAVREIPAGIIDARKALWFVIFNSLAFIVCTYFINMLCFYLSPVALLVILGYSYTKRFTALCHVVLGVGLGLAPIGAYLAVTGVFSLTPIVLGLAVMTWVSGFDIIYALQDEAFDKQHQLHSIPVWLGKLNALRLSRGLHALSGVLMMGFVFLISGPPLFVGWLALLGALVFVALLIVQHRLVRPDDLSKVNIAFFTTNGIASVVSCLLMIIGLLLK